MNGTKLPISPVRSEAPERRETRPPSTAMPLMWRHQPNPIMRCYSWKDGPTITYRCCLDQCCTKYNNVFDAVEMRSRRLNTAASSLE